MEEPRGTGTMYELDTGNFLNSFIGVAKTVILRPSEFYENMPRAAGIGMPLAFLAICLAVSGILTALITWASFSIFFRLFLLGLVFSFISGGILFLIASKVFNGQGGFEGTYRVVAYAGAVNLLTWIPILEIIIALYGFYIQIVGLEKVHQITKGQAVITIIIAIVIYFLFFFLLMH